MFPSKVTPGRFSALRMPSPIRAEIRAIFYPYFLAVAIQYFRVRLDGQVLCGNFHLVLRVNKLISLWMYLSRSCESTLIISLAVSGYACLL